MAQNYVTGPGHLFLGLGGSITNRTPLYAGTGETPPDMDEDPQYVRVMNDASGPSVPFDRIYVGSEAVIQVVLNRFNYGVLRLLESLPNSFAGSRGKDAASARGSLMQHEGLAFPLWITWPFATKPAMAPMGPGRRYLSCIHDRRGYKPGLRDKRVVLNFIAQGVYNPTLQEFVLWDEDMTGLPAVD